MKIGDVVFLNSNPETLMTVSFVMGEKEVTGYAPMMIQQQMRIGGFVDIGWQPAFVPREACTGGTLNVHPEPPLNLI